MYSGLNCSQGSQVLKVDDSVFEDDEAGDAATLPLGTSTPCKSAMTKKSEVKSDPYSLKETIKGEPAKPAMAKKEIVTNEEKMDMS